MSRLTAGALAPDFTLLDQNGVAHQLAALRGKRVLVYFYPKASTPGCTTQACGLRDIGSELAARNTVVFGISPDPVSRLKKFEEKQQLNFTLLSDEDHAVADAFGVWGPKKFMGKEYDGIHRISFLIDEQGVVNKVFDDFKTSNHHEVVLAWLDTL
ncbi:MAG: thioredoxin-dependent thiol peroxidase [Aeromonadaceae bacterium]|nr:thioredoxin-dependent thiol peroxidase [Aeromonadaceae bacterium]